MVLDEKEAEAEAHEAEKNALWRRIKVQCCSFCIQKSNFWPSTFFPLTSGYDEIVMIASRSASTKDLVKGGPVAIARVLECFSDNYSKQYL